MSPWGWTPERTQGIWRVGPAWIKPFVAAAPWVTVMLLALMIYFISGTLTGEKGVLFDLPDSTAGDGESMPLVALVMPTQRETLVFFDDARYILGDSLSSSAFADHLADRLSKVDHKGLLVLADRRVDWGELSRVAAIAKSSGAERILFAEKRKGEITE